MCPQRLFTNTKLFMIAGKRNPTRAWGSPDPAGGAGTAAPRGGRLFLRSARGAAAVRPGRGAAGRRVGEGDGRAAFVFEAPRGPGRGRARAWREPAAPAFP